MSPELREEVARDYFLDALEDPDLVFKIRERQPVDVDSALQIALRLDVWAKETMRHQETAKGVCKVREIPDEEARLSCRNTTERRGEHEEVPGVRTSSVNEPKRWCICEQLSTARSDHAYRTERLQWGIIRSTQFAWAASCKL